MCEIAAYDVYPNVVCLETPLPSDPSQSLLAYIEDANV